ncbi:MAG: nucleotidyltransferase family protein [Alphaproteobacteria bacterium]|nr:nucleotidyltransferase family protein [Alphaproteobacteria bacterium]
MRHAADLLDIIRADIWSMDRLRSVRALGLADWAIGAGFVRGLVWDRLAGKSTRTALPDIDVLYFDAADPHPETEARHEATLAAADPGLPWSVKNQARMHRRNGDPPYRSTEHALTSWLETPTCVAVRLEANDELVVMAPFGLEDLFALRVAPTPAGRRKLDQYRARIAAKGWARVWPLAAIVEG